MIRIRVLVTDVAHVCHGFLFCCTLLRGYSGVATVMVASFSIYQLLDALTGEDLRETLEDAKEFAVGVAVAAALHAALTLLRSFLAVAY